MKAPLSWLQDFVDINVDIETLTHTMIMHGLGIEGIERVYGAYDSIVVGKLKSCRMKTATICRFAL